MFNNYTVSTKYTGLYILEWDFISGYWLVSLSRSRTFDFVTLPLLMLSEQQNKIINGEAGHNTGACK